MCLETNTSQAGRSAISSLLANDPVFNRWTSMHFSKLISILCNGFSAYLCKWLAHGRYASAKIVNTRRAFQNRLSSGIYLLKSMNGFFFETLYSIENDYHNVILKVFPQFTDAATGREHVVLAAVNPNQTRPWQWKWAWMKMTLRPVRLAQSAALIPQR